MCSPTTDTPLLLPGPRAHTAAYTPPTLPNTPYDVPNAPYAISQFPGACRIVLIPFRVVALQSVHLHLPPSEVLFTQLEFSFTPIKQLFCPFDIVMAPRSGDRVVNVDVNVVVVLCLPKLTQCPGLVMIKVSTNPKSSDDPNGYISLHTSLYSRSIVDNGLTHGFHTPSLSWNGAIV